MAKTPPLEKTIVKNILAYLNDLPNTRARKIPGTQYSAGWPDIIAVTDGAVVFVEVKRPRIGRLTDLQRVELDLWQRAGAHCFVSTSVDELKMQMLQAGISPPSSPPP